MDFSAGYEEFALDFIKARSKSVGVKPIKGWTKLLKPQSTILDIGCGNGIPLSQILLASNRKVYAIDASKTMIKSLNKNFPQISAKCETVQCTDFFNEHFDGILAIGLMFLLSESDQLCAIKRIANALNPGGYFLFSAPLEEGMWNDSITSHGSISLGKKKYQNALEFSGLTLLDTISDTSGNTYYSTTKR